MGQHLPDRGYAATLTVGADRVSVRLPDRGQAADVHRRGQPLPDRWQATLTGGADRVGVRVPGHATATSARERGTGGDGRHTAAEAERAKAVNHRVVFLSA